MNLTLTCTTTSSLPLADPDSFKLACHAMTCIGLPIHLYGTWCILCKTSSAMSSAKLLLLWSHCLSALLDLSIRYLSIPYILFPTFSGYPLGQLDMPKLQIYIELTLTALVSTAILSIYENRYYILFGQNSNHWWSRTRRYFLAMNYFLAITFIAPNYLFCPEQKMAIEVVTKRLPCHPELAIDDRHLFVAAIDLNFTFFSITFETFFLLIEVSIFFFIISGKLIYRGHQRKMSLMSDRTHSLQKKFVLSLCIQSTVPFALIVVPIIYVLATLQLNYHNQLLTNLCILTASSHGICSTIVMVLIHKSYREATLDLFCCCCGKLRQKDDPRKFSIATSRVGRNMKF